jgi:protein-disulfide isomerase
MTRRRSRERTPPRAPQQTARERKPYRTPQPTGRGGSGLPLVPLSLAGLGLGLLVVAFVVLSSAPSATPTPGASGSITLAAPWTNYPADNADGSLGSTSAPLVIEEWADYQCPACQTYAERIEPNLVDQYVRPGKVRLVFRDFAFIGAESNASATAAQCAGEQGRYWAYHGYLYPNQGAENSGTFSDAFLRQVAATIRLDTGAFEACRSVGGAAEQRVISSTSQGRSLGVSSTPTIVVGNQQPIVGVPTWDQFKAFLDQVLAAMGAA